MKKNAFLQIMEQHTFLKRFQSNYKPLPTNFALTNFSNTININIYQAINWKDYCMPIETAQ